MDGCQFYDNAVYFECSVLNCFETEYVSIRNSVFRNNTVEVQGNTISLLNAYIEIDNTTMEDNLSTSQSQGVSSLNSNIFAMYCTFRNDESRVESDKLDPFSYYHIGVGGFFKLDSKSNLFMMESTFEN